MTTIYNLIKTQCVYHYQDELEKPHIQHLEGIGFLEKTGREYLLVSELAGFKPMT